MVNKRNSSKRMQKNKTKSKTTNKTKSKTTNKTKKQRGGDVGTQFWNLPSDIGSLAISMVDTMIDTAKLMISVFEIPADLGVAFSDKGAPGVNNP